MLLPSPMIFSSPALIKIGISLLQMDNSSPICSCCPGWLLLFLFLRRSGSYNRQHSCVFHLLCRHYYRYPRLFRMKCLNPCKNRQKEHQYCVIRALSKAPAIPSCRARQLPRDMNQDVHTMPEKWTLVARHQEERPTSARSFCLPISHRGETCLHNPTRPTKLSLNLLNQTTW